MPASARSMPEGSEEDDDEGPSEGRRAGVGPELLEAAPGPAAGLMNESPSTDLTCSRKSSSCSRDEGMCESEAEAERSV